MSLEHTNLLLDLCVGYLWTTSTRTTPEYLFLGFEPNSPSVPIIWRGNSGSGDRRGSHRARRPTLGLGVSEGVVLVAVDENELQGDPKASIMAFLAVCPSEPDADCRDCYSLFIIDHLLGFLHEI